MRNLTLSTITGLGLMASGILMGNPGVEDDGEKTVKEELIGSVAKIYSSNTLLLDNHSHMVRLADVPATARNIGQEAERVKRLVHMVGSGNIHCTIISVDSYGMDLAHCQNHSGQSLNAALAAF